MPKIWALTTVYTIEYCNRVRYDWDDVKNRSNFRKHGVWFEEALQVFDDPRAIFYADDSHSDTEERFILLGGTAHTDVLVVVHCERDDGNVLRIISARKATKKERIQYEKGI
jgi:uncharacterized DUF497 family protein